MRLNLGCELLGECAEVLKRPNVPCVRSRAVRPLQSVQTKGKFSFLTSQVRHSNGEVPIRKSSQPNLVTARAATFALGAFPTSDIAGHMVSPVTFKNSAASSISPHLGGSTN